MNLTDQELVRRSIEGDERAFNELIERYKRGVFTLIIRMVRDRDAAEDLSQETFIRLYASLRSYKPEFKLSGWIFKIANNLAIDHLRKVRPRELSLNAPVETDEGRVEVQVPSRDADPLDRVEALELGEAIQEAILDLPIDYRRVIILRHMEDLTYEEIAEATGLPLGTVKTMIFRGRRLLQKKLRIMRDEG